MITKYNSNKNNLSSRKSKSGRNKKSMISFILLFALLFTSIPMESFAATPTISINRFQFIQEVSGGKTKNKIEITGFNFVEYINNNPVDVVRNISIGNGTATTTMQDIIAAGGKVTITETLIRIEAPDTGPITLGMNTNGTSYITITARDQSAKVFETNVNQLPSVGGSFVESKLYAGQPVEIEGSGFTGVTDFMVAGASHSINTPITDPPSGHLTVTATKLSIDALQKNILGTETSIILRKENTTTVSGQVDTIPVIFSVDYKNRVTVYDRLSGMDNLLVLPSEGPVSKSSLITVYAMDELGTTKLTNKFTDKMRIFLRKAEDNTIEIPLQNVELKYEKIGLVDTVVGITGYTPAIDSRKEVDKLYHAVIRDPANPLAEGIKKNAYTFVTGDPAPSIVGLYPGEGPSTGGTDVTIVGRNIINVASSGITKPQGVEFKAESTPSREGNDTLVIDYDILGETASNKAMYGEKQIVDIQRKIKTKISLYTTPKELEIQYSKLNTESYGTAHYTTITEDGLVVTTPNANVDGPQAVILEIETIMELEDGTVISIPEGTRYSSFIYKEVEPRPVIQSVEPPYGYYYNVDAVEKPLMIRIKGSKFQAIKDPVTGEISYPEVKFKLPDGQSLPVKISKEPGDIKVLDKGAQIDGQFKTLGDTLVVSVLPDSALGDLKSLILKEALQPDGYRFLYGIVEVQNPQGGTNILSTEGVKFEFRHPDDVLGNTTAHSKQPIISQVLLNGNVPVQKLSSDKDNEVEIRFSTRAGLSDLSKVKVTIDGMDISNKISSRTNDGNQAVIKVVIPRGIVGKTRLQIILNEGLMDSYDITFDNLLGPEIKDITPDTGDAGTIAIIKRDTKANTIGFKPALSTSADEQERVGSRVLLNGQDINELFSGYSKDVDGKVIYQDSDIFTNFTDPSQPLSIPGKYIYVVDADTIYMKLPEAIDAGKYTIQIKNPDGSESTSAKIFTVIDSIAKTKIGTIDPGQDDETGGIITTITADTGTNFKGEIDVYFGSQKATVVGYNLDYTKAYVKVPPLTDFKFPTNPADIDKIQSFTVPVTVANKVNKSTDTKSDGFIYLNPNYTVKITKIYREGMSSTDQNANKVNVGDYIWIEGENFRGTTTDGKTVENLPIVMFGYTKVQAEDYDIMNIGADRAELSRIKVKVPPKPINAANDGSVDILVQNYDGAKAIQPKGVIYGTGNPSIDEKTSILRARKTGERIEIFAKEVFKDGLIVAFGDRTYKKELGSNQKDFITNEKGELEQIVVRYVPGQTENIEVYYRDPSGALTLMEDATLLTTISETVTGGKIALGNEPGITKIIGINWQNPDYHKATSAASNPDQLKTYNKEYMSIKTIQEGSNNYLEIRRALGKVESFKIDKLNNSVIGINTPFHDKIEKTTITLINSDGSSATAPFEFHGGLDAPVITDLEGSKDRNVMIDGAQQKVKVKTQDYTVDGTLKVLGKNFKDVQSVKIGTKEVKVESVSQDYTYMIVSVPKGTPEEVGQPLQVTVVTKEGNAFSSRTEPPVYFMYIAADSKPVIETVTPVVGPRTGGTLVTIKGKGFREKDEFGVISDNVDERITITVNGSMPAGLKSTVKNEQGEIVELKVIMPPSVTGKAKLQVINADGGTSEPKDFTYISQPKISQTEGSLFFNDTTTEVRLFGEDFQSGAKVVIGADQTKGKKPADASVSGMIGVTADGQNQEGHLVGGVEAADVKVTGTNQITFKMPDGIESLENTSIIIVNPDTGMSEPGQGNIKPPVPDVPDIEAIPGFERTMILRWTVDKDVLNAAEKFEIYVRERRSGDYTFVGDTKQDTTEQSYVIKGLKYDTTYDILVRVLNKYGEAEDFGSVRETTLKQNQDYKEKEKVEAVDKAVTQIETQGKQEVIGDTLYYTVGTRESTINLSNTTAKNKTKYVQIPVRDIKAGNKTITITDKDLSLTVSYSSLNTPELRNVPDDAVFRFKISAAEKQIEEGLTRAIPRVYKKASNVYGIYFELAQPKLVTPIAMLSGSATININAPAYPKYHAVYIESADTFSILQSNIITQGGNYVLLTNK